MVVQALTYSKVYRNIAILNKEPWALQKLTTTPTTKIK